MLKARKWTVMILVGFAILVLGISSVSAAGTQYEGDVHVSTTDYIKSKTWDNKLIKYNGSWNEGAPIDNAENNENLEVYKQIKIGTTKTTDAWGGIKQRFFVIHDNEGHVLKMIPKWRALHYEINGDRVTRLKYLYDPEPGDTQYLYDVNILDREFIYDRGKDEPATDAKITFEVQANDLTDLLNTAADPTTAFNRNYYIEGGEATDSDISSMNFELMNVPFRISRGSFERIPNIDLSGLTGGSLGTYTVIVDLQKTERGSSAEFKMGSHSISWTVSSLTDWCSNASSENDVRTTVSNGSLELNGKNTVGWWSMDDDGSAGTLYDLTSLDTDGSINGPTYTATSKFGHALEFDESNSDYVNLGDLNNWGFEGRDQFSISLWAKLRSGTTTGPRSVITNGGSNNNTFIIQLDLDDNTFHYYVDGDGGQIDIQIGDLTTFDVHNWHHYTFIYEAGAGTPCRIYVDGTLNGSYDSDIGTVHNSLNDIYIGRYMTREYWDGWMDELQVFNSAISQNQIDRIRNRTSPSSMTGSDLRSGTWTSQVWDTGLSTNWTFSSEASISPGENIFATIGADFDGDNMMDENKTFELDNGAFTENLNFSDYSQAGKASFELETGNTTHSPELYNYEVTAQEANTPTIENINCSKTMIDRDVDYPPYGTVDNVRISATIKDNNGYEDIQTVHISIRDNTDTTVISGAVVTENKVINRDTLEFSYNLNPNDLTDSAALGGYDVEFFVSDITNRTDETGFEEAFSVSDSDVSVNNTTAYYDNTIEISGSINRYLGTSTNLDQVTIKDAKEGTFQAGVTGNEFSESYTVKSAVGSRVDVYVYAKDGNLDGSAQLTYEVQSAAEKSTGGGLGGIGYIILLIIAVPILMFVTIAWLASRNGGGSNRR